MMPKYISVTQARTARFHSQDTHPEIVGLYSDNFSECNIIIFRKKYPDHTRISLTHADTVISPDFIVREIEWVGQDCEKLIFRKRDNAKAPLVTSLFLSSQQLKSYTIQALNQEIYAISVDSHEIMMLKADEIPELACHPKEWQFHHTYTLNSLFDTETQKEHPVSPLIFDSKNWIEIDEVQFTKLEQAQDFYNQLNEQLAQYPIPCRSLVTFITQEIIKKSFPDLNHPTGIVMISFAALVLLNQNRYQDIFQNELKFIDGNMHLCKPAATALQRKLVKDINQLMLIDYQAAIQFVSQHKEDLRCNQTLGSIVGITSLTNKLQKHSQTHVMAQVPGRFFEVARADSFEDEEKTLQP